MKVLILTSAFPPVAGGAETYALTIARGLSYLGVEVVVATNGVGSPQSADETLQVRRLTHFWGSVVSPEKLMWEQMNFALLTDLHDLLVGFRPDVIMTNNLETSILGRMVADSLRIPMVSVFHEHDPLSEPFGIGKVRMAYLHAKPDRIICGSRYYWNRAVAFAPPESVRLVSHGVDVERFQTAAPWPREVLGAMPGEKLIVCIGRIKHRKGQDLLIDALSDLGRSDWKAALLGSVSSASLSFRAEIESQIARLALNHRVRLIDDIPVDSVPNVLRAADVAVVPSREEGLGFSVLEAFASRVPTVTAPVSGIAEIIEEVDCAWTFRSEQVLDLADAINQAIEFAPAGAARVERAAQLVRDRFSIGEMARATLRVLEEVVPRV